jgi:hypothetical protein
MKKIHFLSVCSTSILNIIVIPVLLYSCILTPEEENFTKIDVKADPSKVALLTYGYDKRNYFPVKDTLWIGSQIHIKLQDGFVYDLEVLINNVVFIRFGNPMGVVSISKDKLPSRHNIITVRQRVKSGTGSLADKVGGEYAEFQSQFVLVHDDNTFVPQITGIAFEDGTVRVQWNEFTRSDFQYYRIVKLVETVNGYQEFRSFTFNDQLQNSFIDTTYVGGTINYKLAVSNGAEMTSEAYPFNYTYEPSVTLIKAGTNFNLSFTPPPFYKNVKFYKTAFYNYNSLNGTQVITSNEVSPDDLSLDISGPHTIWSHYEVRYNLRG